MILKSDFIITAYAERCSGPGWANAPVIAIVQNKEGVIREEYIQPDKQTTEMVWLYDVCEMAHLSMRTAVRRTQKKK